MTARQLDLPATMKCNAAPGSAVWPLFPQTRYLGSKRKLLGLLFQTFGQLEFDSVLDPFSGTAAVAFLLKAMGKSVTASDILASNAIAARALVLNNQACLGNAVDGLMAGLPDTTSSPGFIEQTFEDIFFEPIENRFLDGILPRIHKLEGFERDLALYALFQACLAKRPYNLFHRANLAMRRRDVRRSFGNKTTWERPFPELMTSYAAEADQAVFASPKKCHVCCGDVLEIDPSGYDAVYLDPPYVSGKGAGVDYLDYYHFLEGLASPDTWSEKILTKYKHKPLQGRGQSPWSDPRRIEDAFGRTVERFADATFVISYRSDGIPSIDAIAGYLKRVGKAIAVIDAGKYTYALSRNTRSREVILVGS
ncbi:MAG: DNA adenine methylase [Myxococcota bacterium]|nr:DNA adenine methylase [Myxococcota bacterium]